MFFIFEAKSLLIFNVQNCLSFLLVFSCSRNSDFFFPNVQWLNLCWICKLIWEEITSLGVQLAKCLIPFLEPWWNVAWWAQLLAHPQFLQDLQLQLSLAFWVASFLILAAWFSNTRSGCLSLKLWVPRCWAPAAVPASVPIAHLCGCWDGKLHPPMYNGLVAFPYPADNYE